MANLRRAALFLLPLALAVPFDPQWPDFERARRGVLLIVAGLALVAVGVRRSPSGALAWLLGLAVVALASATWARDPWPALEQGAYLLGLVALVLTLSADATVRRGLVAGTATALLVTSLYGLLQSLGWLWPPNYVVAGSRELVSSLGNRNVAAEWTALAAPLALAAPPLFGWPAVVAAGAYLWANGGRAGLLAFHLGVVLLLVLRRQRAAPKLATLLIAAAVVGWILRPSAPAAEPPQASTSANTTAARAAAGDPTLDVRLRVWRGTLAMTRDHLPLGAGAGSFTAAFPPYRDPVEVRVSGTGSRVKTPHDDPLQIVAELGLPGLVLLAGFAVALWRSWRRGALDATALATLAAFLPVTLLRSPLFNAPAALAAVAALALALPASPIAPTWRRLASRLLGLPLLALGLSLVAGESSGAGFLRAKLVGDGPAGMAAIERAIAVDPLEPDWRLLRAQVHQKRGQPVPAAHLPAVLADLEAVLARRPHDTMALLCLSDLGLRHAAHGERGRAAAEHLLRLDPGHPLARLHAANYAFLASDWQKGGEILLQLTDGAAIESAIELVRGFKDQAMQVEDRHVVVELARLAVRLQQKLR